MRSLSRIRIKGISLFFACVVLLPVVTVLTSTCIALTEEEAAKAQLFLERALTSPVDSRRLLAEDNSPEAEMMKREINNLLRSGKTVDQIKEFYIQKYGSRIETSSKKEKFNMFSFLMPVFVFAMGVLIILLTLRRWIMKQSS